MMQKILGLSKVGAAVLLVGVVALGAGCAQKEVRQDGERDIRLIQSKRGAAVAVRDKLLFDFGKSTLRPEGADALDTVAQILKVKQNKTVLVEGHTDNRGSRTVNQKLSNARAQTVRSALVQRGIAPERLQARGYGFDEPIASNDTRANRQRNRRVEVVFPQETLESLKQSLQSQDKNLFEAFKSLF